MNTKALRFLAIPNVLTVAGALLAATAVQSGAAAEPCTGAAIAPSFESPGEAPAGVATFGNRVALIDDAGPTKRLLLCEPDGSGAFVIKESLPLPEDFSASTVETAGPALTLEGVERDAASPGGPPAIDGFPYEASSAANAPAADVEPIPLAEPKQGEELFIIGLDSNKKLLARLDRGLGVAPRADTPNLLEPLAQFGPGCRAHFLERGLVFHTCETEVGTSGSPALWISRAGSSSRLGAIPAGSAQMVKSRSRTTTPGRWATARGRHRQTS